ncbi:antibiotic biosynthesis monooxygenase family protein [Intrasporangium sp.]|uniref:antibiotic biosynthesis monooxygenase family protein n=1 Tax=Intrasporangium sp. TaxID=1925024 RepID=UPI0032214998
MTELSPEDRTAAANAAEVDGPVTLINGFVVDESRDEAFTALWRRTSEYFVRQPGFVSLRLHRALSPGAQFRWVNVAGWESERAYRAAHSTDEFRRVVTAAGWQAFPSVPTLYEVDTEVVPA